MITQLVGPQFWILGTGFFGCDCTDDAQSSHMSKALNCSSYLIFNFDVIGL